MTRNALSLETGITNPSDPGRVRMGDLVGKLLAIQPLGTEELDTEINGKAARSEATIAYVLEIAASGVPIDHGEHPIFWHLVRRQLDESPTADAPWVLGRVDKLSRAYVLRNATADEAKRAHRQIKSWARTAAEARAHDGEPDDDDVF